LAGQAAASSAAGPDCSSAPKSSVRAQPLEEIGKKAVEVLLAQMHDGVPAQMYELESRVIVRESTIHFVPAQS